MTSTPVIGNVVLTPGSSVAPAPDQSGYVPMVTQAQLKTLRLELEALDKRVDTRCTWKANQNTRRYLGDIDAAHHREIRKLGHSILFLRASVAMLTVAMSLVIWRIA